LFQVVNGEKRLIEFFSQSFNKTQRRYATIETAIIAALRKWRYYLFGASIIVETDHKPLIWLLSKKDLENKLGRMAYELSEYNIKRIEHIKGEDNVLADALSRLDLAVLGEWDDAEHDRRLEELVIKDPQRFIKKSDGKIFLLEKDRSRLCLHRKEDINKVLVSLHDNAGHLGYEKVQAGIGRRFFWPNWRSHLKEHLKECRQCALKKDDLEPNKEPLQPLVSRKVFERVHMDILGPLSSSGGFRYVLVAQDAFSKWLLAEPMKDIKAKTVIRKCRKWIKEFGSPERIVTDRGSQFESEEFKKFCEDNWIEHHLTTIAHHQGNGLVERAIRTIEQMLRVSGEQANWHRTLKKCVEAYNSAKHCSTGFSPFMILFGREKLEQIDREFELEEQTMDVDKVRKQARKNMKVARRKMKKSFDKSTKKGQNLQTGTFVAWHQVSPSIGTARKLNQKWRGPFKIEQIHRKLPLMRIIGRGHTGKWIHKNHLKKWHGNATKLDTLRSRGRPSFLSEGEM